MYHIYIDHINIYIILYYIILYYIISYIYYILIQWVISPKKKVQTVFHWVPRARPNNLISGYFCTRRPEEKSLKFEHWLSKYILSYISCFQPEDPASSAYSMSTSFLPGTLPLVLVLPLSLSMSSSSSLPT